MKNVMLPVLAVQSVKGSPLIVAPKPGLSLTLSSQYWDLNPYYDFTHFKFISKNGIFLNTSQEGLLKEMVKEFHCELHRPMTRPPSLALSGGVNLTLFRIVEVLSAVQNYVLR